MQLRTEFKFELREDEELTLSFDFQNLYSFVSTGVQYSSSTRTIMMMINCMCNHHKWSERYIQRNKIELEYIQKIANNYLKRKHESSADDHLHLLQF